MDPAPFTLGSPVHIVSVAICFGAAVAVGVGGIRLRHHPAALSVLRRLVAIGCLVSWIANSAIWMLPEFFSWDRALPLHFCNLANLIGAVAVWRQVRITQALLYFWMFALCIWAFLTPSLLEGPESIGFWIFWFYHLLIPVSTAWVLAVDGFHPHWRDLRNALGLTFSYLLVLTVVNAITGWNYGFVGPGKPGQPSPIDVLGPYPLRIVWMSLIGSILFTLLLLPWLRRERTSGEIP